MAVLPLPLLRMRTRKGSASLLFCSSGDDGGGELRLAKDLIREFEQVAKSNQKKGILLERVSRYEDRDEYDYKLVRGFYTLLERRSVFRKSAKIDPVYVRRLVFEESSRRGLALTDLERSKIIEKVASKVGISAGEVEEVMWSDLEENLQLHEFDSIGAEDLLGWYNLSLLQTMLFNGTKLEFSVHGGINWKRILRNVKWLGLMYSLQRVSEGGSKGSEPLLVCSIDGPLSLFKLTDKYGTSIAKLLPSITASEQWSLRAWIVRKTTSGRKVFEFELTDKEAPSLFDPYMRKKEGDTTATANIYDSSVEESFAKKFEQLDTGWKLVREPDPLIAQGKALIPDFMFEKYNRRVYLEIVGFWTKEYLQNKMRKLSASASTARGGSEDGGEAAMDMLVAVNEELACSKLSSLPKDRVKVIPYRHQVPVKPILEHLRTIEKEIMDASLSELPRIDIKSAEEVIPIEQIAREYGIPEEYALKILSKNEQYLIAGRFLVSKIKAHKLEGMLEGVNRFVEACSVLARNGIPEPCHAELI
ncbi:MAG: DUF790 family protein, partial [Nitrososphaerales archaeon]